MSLCTDSQDACRHATAEIGAGTREIGSGLRPLDVTGLAASVAITAML